MSNVLKVLKDLLYMPEYDGTRATSIKRKAAKDAARHAIKELEKEMKMPLSSLYDRLESEKLDGKDEDNAIMSVYEIAKKCGYTPDELVFVMTAVRAQARVLWSGK